MSSQALPIFVLSDDSSAFDELYKIPDLSIYYNKLISKRQGFDLSNDNEFSHENLFNLLLECEIAKKSQYFVGTFTSNVSRFIKLIHEHPENCHSLDIPWHFVNNCRVYN